MYTFDFQMLRDLVTEVTGMNEMVADIKLKRYFAKNDTSKDIMTLDRIFTCVCDNLHLEPEYVLSRTREKAAADARKLFAYIAFNNLPISNQKLGEYINRDHCTVLHYKSRAQNHIDNEREFRLYYERICHDLGILNGKGKV